MALQTSIDEGNRVLYDDDELLIVPEQRCKLVSVLQVYIIDL